MRKIRTIHVNPVGSGKIVFNDKDNTVISAGMRYGISIWDIDTGSLKQTLDTESDVVGSVLLNSDASILISSGDTTGIKFWDTESWKNYQTFEAPKGRIGNIILDPDNEILSRLNFSTGNIELWNIIDGKITTMIDFGYGVFHPLKPILIVGFENVIRFYETKTGLCIGTHTISEQILAGLTISPDGTHIAFENASESVVIAELEDMRIKHILPDHFMRYPVFSHNGKVLAVATEPSTVSLWDVTTGEKCDEGMAEFVQVNNVVFNQDSSILLCGSGGIRDGLIEIWDISNITDSNFELIDL